MMLNDVSVLATAIEDTIVRFFAMNSKSSISSIDCRVQITRHCRFQSIDHCCFADGGSEPGIDCHCCTVQEGYTQ